MEILVVILGIILVVGGIVARKEIESIKDDIEDGQVVGRKLVPNR